MADRITGNPLVVDDMSMDGNLAVRSRNIKSQLTARHAELRERVRRVRGRRRLARRPFDGADADILSENERILRRIEDGARREIEEIERALARIEIGASASCEKCGEQIDDRRAEVLPATTICGCCASPRR